MQCSRDDFVVQSQRGLYQAHYARSSHHMPQIAFDRTQAAVLGVCGVFAPGTGERSYLNGVS